MKIRRPSLTGVVTVEAYTLELAIIYLAMIIVGGMGSIAGAVLGAVFAAQSGAHGAAHALRADVIDGVQAVFIVAAPLAALALLVVLRLPEVPLQTAHHKS